MSNQASFKGQQLTFLGLNNDGMHNLVFPPAPRRLAGIHRRARSSGSTCHRLRSSRAFSRASRAARSISTFSKVERPGRAIILGRGLAAPMPDWVAEQIDMSDYVKLLQPPVGTWNGETYRVSIDADAHNFNFRSDIFSNEELGARVDRERRS